MSENGARRVVCAMELEDEQAQRGAEGSQNQDIDQSAEAGRDVRVCKLCVYRTVVTLAINLM